MDLRRYRSIFSILALVAALALVLTACGDDATDDTTTDDTADTADGEVAEDGEATGEPIRIGMLTSLTGPFTPWGVQVRAGMQLAIDEINEEGGIDGRPLEMVEADDQNNPEEATNAFERMVERDGVVAVGGVISSDVGLASSRVAEELEVPLFLVKAGAAGILTQDSRYTFRTCLPAAPMVAEPVVQYIQDQGESRVGAIIADYAWGQSIREALENSIEAAGDIEYQIEVSPVDETDFTTYLRNLEQFDPDIIVATGHPPGSGPITLQSTDLGIDVPVTGSWVPLSLIFEGVGEAAYDKYVDFKCSDNSTEDYQDLARRFAESTGEGYMEDDAVAAYGYVQMIAEAIREVGDDPAAIAEYLHGNSFDLPGYSHTVSWTEWGELAESQPALVIIREQAPPEGINEGANWWPEVLLVSEPLEPYVPE